MVASYTFELLIRELGKYLGTAEAGSRQKLQKVTVDPSVFPAALGVLSNTAIQGGHKISKAGLADVIDSVILRHAPLAHGSEVAWSLWTALCFNIRLTAAAASAVSQMDDDVVALLSLDANIRGLFPANSLDSARWDSIAAMPDAAEGEHWLLAYEGSLKGWLHAPAIAGDPLFSLIRGAGVSFYDPAAAAPGFPAAGYSAPGGTLPAEYA